MRRLRLLSFEIVLFLKTKFDELRRQKRIYVSNLTLNTYSVVNGFIAVLLLPLNLEPPHFAKPPM